MRARQFMKLTEQEVGTQTVLDDLPLFEMANLRERQTGIPGTIYISTRQGRHGPHVNYLLPAPVTVCPASRSASAMRQRSKRTRSRNPLRISSRRW